MKKVFLFLASCMLVATAGAKTVTVSNSDLSWERNDNGEMEARIVIGSIGCQNVELNFTGGNQSKVPCYRVAIIDNGDPDYDYWHELSDWNDILEVNSSGNGSTTISLTACGVSSQVIAFFIQLDKNPNAPTQYSVSLLQNDSPSRGTLTGEGTYNEGERVQISAEPYSDYVFKEWSDGNTNNPRYITVTSDIELVAYFDVIPEYDFMIDGIAYNILNTNEAEVTKNSRYYNSDYSGDVVIPSSVTYKGKSYSVTAIDAYAFANCGKLTSITIPTSVTRIEEHAFRSCTGLTSINIPNGVRWIEDGAFIYCGNVTSVTIPRSVLSIGEYAFYLVDEVTGNSSVRAVDLPYDLDLSDSGLGFTYNGINYLIKNNREVIVESGDYDSWRSEYEIPSIVSLGDNNFTVSSIGEWAFWEYELTAISIPNSVSSIGPIAFAENNFTSITIPSSVSYIGGGCFYECKKLTSITCLAKTPPTMPADYYFGESGLEIIPTFYNNGANITVYVPNDAVSAYKSASVWKNLNIQPIQGENYTITLSVNNNSYGTVIGGGEYIEGTTVTIAAVASSGYEFEQWNDGNTENPRTITVTENVGFIANFKAIPTQTNYYTITLSSNNDEFGSVMGDGEFKEGEKVSLIAIPAMGYRFVQWSDGNTQNPREITVSSNASYAATFEQTSSGELDYTVTAIPASNDQGTVVGGGIYGPLSTVTLAVVPATGYKFVQWNDGNTDNPRVVIVMGDCFYVATFEKISTDISEVENAMNVAIINRQIVVNGEAPAFVYTIMGQKIANQNLKSGVYFVVVDGETVKVSVQ